MLTQKQQAYLSAMDIDVWQQRQVQTTQSSLQVAKVSEVNQPAAPTKVSANILCAKLQGCPALDALYAEIDQTCDAAAQQQLLEKIASSIATSAVVTQVAARVDKPRQLCLQTPLPTLAMMLSDPQQKRLLWQHLKHIGAA